MSIRLQMLQIARVAPRVLGESAALVGDFLRGQQNDDGGFKDRAGRSDLYYTVFGMDGLLALQAAWPASRTLEFVRGYAGGDGLDFVHLCCLARCWAALSALTRSDIPEEWRTEILHRVERFRSQDGGYHPVAGKASGTAYGCFLALGAHQDLRATPPDSDRLIHCLNSLETCDGAWANERGVTAGATNATAATATLLQQLRMPVRPAVADWLLARRHPQGGFLAGPAAPIPDLLSTATALHALTAMERDVSDWRESCLDFIDSLWTNVGAFHGHWGEETLDCEYTYYGLLALGHLAL